MTPRGIYGLRRLLTPVRALRRIGSTFTCVPRENENSGTGSTPLQLGSGNTPLQRVTGRESPFYTTSTSPGDLLGSEASPVKAFGLRRASSKPWLSTHSSVALLVPPPRTRRITSSSMSRRRIPPVNKGIKAQRETSRSCSCLRAFNFTQDASKVLLHSALITPKH